MIRINQTATKKAYHYIPALRWKAGEIRAYKMLAAASPAGSFTPLFLIDSVKERQQNESTKRLRVPSGAARYLDFVASELQKHSQGRPYFLDTSLFDRSQERARSPVDGAQHLFGNVFNVEILLKNAIPVVRLTDSADRIAAFRAASADRGAAIRLNARQFGERETLNTLLSSLRLQRSVVDLVLDLGDVKDHTEYGAKKAVVREIVALHNKNDPWRSVIILAGSYPRTVEKQAGPTSYLRHCFLAYETLRVALENAGVKAPAFGDYGIINADAEPTSGSRSGGGSWPIIRYCSSTEWQVFKSLLPAESGSVSPYFGLARQCAGSFYFMGRQFSYGDRYIEDRARADVRSPGQSLSYLTVDINHHLTHTLAQLMDELPPPMPVPTEELKPPTSPLDADDDIEDLLE